MPPPPPPRSLRLQADVSAKEKILPPKRTKVTDMASYHARWQIVEKNIHYRHPPEEKTDSIEPIMQIQTPGSLFPEKTPLKEPLHDLENNTSRSRSGTPITSWERSPTKLASSPVPGNKLLSIDYTITTSSSLVPPTPAQRIKRPTVTPEDHLSSSYPATANESILDIEVDVPEDENGVRVRPVVRRKVPRPTSPQPRRYTGPARVLVPNSDTSGTQSQSLSLTQQSQSLSQSQPRPLESDEQVGSKSQDNAFQQADRGIGQESDDDMAMEVDHEQEEEDEKKVRRSLTMSPEAASSDSSRGKSPSPEKSVDGDGRRYADGSESDGGSGGEGSEERAGSEMDEDEDEDGAADGSDDGYPWITLWSVRGVIVKADALRRAYISR
ncbi:hypothetical protein BJ912DRAFT_952591 [Pholiota molesta]|nr:hypothetical protein BJ912DRAFT_952591 [Pholiota molesta]